MSNSTPLLSRLWRRLFPASPQPQPVRLSATARPLPKRSRLEDRPIEPLEGRIAPATLLPGGKTLTYTDTDGDLVTITFSKQLFVPNTGGSTDGILQQVFTFSAGKAHSGEANATDDVPQLLQSINLTKIRFSTTNTPAIGVSFSITAHQQDANHDGVMEGDGKVNVGAIASTGISLGNVSVGGDLGQIDAGSGKSKVAVKSLSVGTLGKLTNTQAGTANYESLLVGRVNAFSADSLEGGYLHVTSGSNLKGKVVAPGDVGTIQIANFIKPRDPTVSATNDGRIDVAGNVTSLTIGSGHRDTATPILSDGLNGGIGINSATVSVGGTLGRVVVDGDLQGGTGTGSGSLTAGTINSLVVKGSLVGSGTNSASIKTQLKLGTATIGLAGGPGLVGGTGDSSAVVSSNGAIESIHLTNIVGLGSNSGGVTAAGKITSIVIAGSLQGGAATHSGFLEGYGHIGSITIGGKIEGGDGLRSGIIVAGGNLDTFSLAGHLLGGAGSSSGSLTTLGSLGLVKIGDGLFGGNGVGSGVVSAGTTLKNMTVSRTTAGQTDAVLGGNGTSSGSIYAFGSINKVTLQGSLQGGVGDASGTVQAHELLKTLSINGDILGGGGVGSGAVLALDQLARSGQGTAGALGTVTVAGSLLGGTGSHSGLISADGAISSLTVSGLFKGTPADSGQIVAGAGLYAAGQVGTLVLGTVGTPAPLDGTGSATGPERAGGSVIAFGKVTSLTATSLYQGEIHAAQSIASLVVNGAVTGSKITAGGNVDATGTLDVALAKVVVRGNVSESSILAGYGVSGAADNGHAQIGTVRVTGNWSASNLVAGVRDVAGDGFGNADDARIAGGGSSSAISRIASVLIDGNITPAGNGQTGFVAQEIGSFSTSAGTLPLAKTTPGQIFQLLASAEASRVTVREVSSPT